MLRAGFFRTLSIGLVLAAGCGGESGSGGLLAPAVTPDAVDFGRIDVGLGVTRPLTIRNVGASELVLTVDTIGASVFIVEDAPGVIRPNGEAPVRVTFEPSAAGTFEGRLRIRTSGDLNTTVPLTGEGVSTPWTVSSPSLDFGSVPLGFSRDSVVQLTNGGDRAAVPRVLGLPSCDEGPRNGLCVVVADAPVAPGATVSMRVRFEPLNVLPVRATLVIGEARIEVRGEGVREVIDCPPTVDLGAVNPGSCVSRPLECRAFVAGDVGVEVPQTAAGLTVTPVQQPAEAGEAIVFVAELCPRRIGEIATGVVVRSSAAPNKTETVRVSGRGGGGDASVVQETLDAGLVGVGYPAVFNVVFLVNVGFEALEVSDATSDNPAVTTRSFDDGPVDPGDAFAGTVTVDPTVVGPGTAAITLSTDDVDTPVVTLTVTYEALDVEPCRVEVRPEVLDFGDVLRLSRTVRTLDVISQSANACLLYEPRLFVDGFLGSAELGGAGDWPRAQLLPPGGRLSLPVELATGITGAVRPTATIRLAGAGPQLPRDVSVVARILQDGPLSFPDRVEFGRRAVGCDAPPVAVRTYLEGGARLLAVETTGDPGFEVDAPTLPTAVNGEVAVGVSFEARAVGPASAQLALRYEDGEGSEGTLRVDLSAEVAEGARIEERFATVDNTMADVLLVVDHSSCLAQEHAWLEDRVEALVGFAETLGLDYRVAMTTSDTDDEMGRFCPFVVSDGRARVISPDLADPAEQLARNLPCRPFIGGAAVDESPLWAATQALELSNLVGHNAGFYRPEASLSVLMVTDEPEQSPEAVDYYLDRLRRLKGVDGRNQVTFNAIAGLRDEACAGEWGSSQRSPRIHDAVDKTGGVVFDVCDLPTQQERPFVGATMSERSKFLLRTAAAPTTIEVAVDGRPLPPSQWRYVVRPAPAIELRPDAAPEAGAAVDVSYAAACR